MAPKQKTDRTEDELKANLYSLSLVAEPDDNFQDTKMKEDNNDDEEETSFKIEDIPIKMDLPAPRFNAALAVGMDDKLYIYGGTYEDSGRGEMTIDDFHVIDLGKLDGVRELWNNTTFKPEGDEIEDESTDSDSDSSDNDKKMEDLDDNGLTNQKAKDQQQQMDIDIPSKEEARPTSTTSPDDDDDGTTPTTATEEVTTSFNPKYPAPLPFESIKSYYDRTGKEWIILIADGSKAGRREAFVKAEGYWWECREEIREIEERMDESGVKEVVSVQFDKRDKRR